VKKVRKRKKEHKKGAKEDTAYRFLTPYRYGVSIRYNHWASVERLFSLCGLIHTARRNTLGPGLFDALISFGMNDSTLQELRRARLENRLGPDQLNNAK
jgi:hypothetical protein